MEKRKGKRKKRYVRDQSVNISLQDRDIAICTWVNKYRILSSEQIVAIVNGTKQVILRRLNLLFHTGYLERVRLENSHQNTAMFYGLGNKGALKLSECFGYNFPKTDVGRKNRELKDKYVQHALEVNEFLIAIQVACRNHPDLEFIDEEELVKHRPIPSTKIQQAMKWPVIVNPGEFGQKEKMGLAVVPDGVFAIRCRKKGQVKVSFFFLEIDRSTMPIKRSDFGQTSFYRKFIGYITSYRYQLFGKYWGFNSVRVLIVAKSKERIANLLSLGQELHPKRRGYRLFCFAGTKAICTKTADQVLGRIWIDGENNMLSLLD